jgi:hypothetical protein
LCHLGTATALFLAGCQTSGPSHAFTWRSLSKGLVSGLTTPRHVVIRDEASYLKLWAEHAANSNLMALPPNVDFTREMVIAVAMGIRPTGGYLIEVVDVQLRGRSLRVLVGEREPRPGTLQIQQETQPYQFIALPMVTGRVEFRTVYEAGTRASRRSARPGTEGETQTD